MHSEPGIGLDLLPTRRWFERSLDRGDGVFASALTSAVTKRLPASNRARLLVADDDPHRLPLTDIGLGQSASKETLRAYLAYLAGLGGNSLIVEADVEDAAALSVGEVVEPNFVLGRRIERFAPVDDWSADEHLLRTAAWPLNAFVSSMTEGELAAINPESDPDELSEGIVSTMLAAITIAFDGEAYVALRWVDR